ENVASVVTASDKGGATHVDIASDSELVKSIRNVETNLHPRLPLFLFLLPLVSSP
ncbi:hypothetical protein LINGRAHAP2_LOCUS29094, partial [Linum grandiflorum]